MVAAVMTPNPGMVSNLESVFLKSKMISSSSDLSYELSVQTDESKFESARS